MLFKKLSLSIPFLLMLNWDLATSANSTANVRRVKRIAYGLTPSPGQFKFVVRGLASWCEKTSGTETCQSYDYFTATIISNGYMIASSNFVPCVTRYRILYGEKASGKYTFENMTFEFSFGMVYAKDVPTQRIVANYPGEMDMFFEFTRTIIPAKPDPEMYCAIEPPLVLFYVNTYIEFNEFVQPIPILRMPIPTIDEHCIAVSFYGNYLEELYDGRLFHIAATVGDLDYCKKLDNRSEFAFGLPYTVCSKGNDYLREVCFMDLGSPLICGGQSPYLVGILTSPADPYPIDAKVECGKSPTYYGQYIYPGYFESWLQKIEAQFVDAPNMQRRARMGRKHQARSNRNGISTTEVATTESATTESAGEAKQEGLHHALTLFVILFGCYFN